MGWQQTGAECRRCHEGTLTCPKCTGDGRVAGFPGFMIDCPDCKGTGYRCPNHDGDWK